MKVKEKIHMKGKPRSFTYVSGKPSMIGNGVENEHNNRWRR